MSRSYFMVFCCSFVLPGCAPEPWTLHNDVLAQDEPENFHMDLHGNVLGMTRDCGPVKGKRY